MVVHDVNCGVWTQDNAINAAGLMVIYADSLNDCIEHRLRQLFSNDNGP
jgi:hypothetical protein